MLLVLMPSRGQVMGEGGKEDVRLSEENWARALTFPRESSQVWEENSSKIRLDAHKTHNHFPITKGDQNI